MRNIILGTDWWSDCDDAVALRLLTHSVKDKRINLLGVCINACMEHSAASLRGFLHADGLYNVPIGLDTSAVGYEGAHLALYQKRLAEEFCPDGTNADAEDGVRLYRRLLSKCPNKVEIIEIGFLGVFAKLLLSEGDDISDMSGIDLVQKKVEKIWVMGGKWDTDGGLEHNFALNEHTRAASHTFCKLCPVPITFLGFEVGLGVITGGMLEPKDHLYRVMVDYKAESGRHSWDPMLAMMAIIGDEATAGYNTICGRASVDANTGANHFKADNSAIHKYVTKARENKYYEDEINAYLNLT